LRNTLLLTAFICAAAVPGKSASLGIWNGNFGASGNAATVPVVGTLAIGPTTEAFCPAADCPTFFVETVTPSDVGDSYTFDSTSANFSQVTGLFTDNQQDYVWELGATVSGGGGGNGAYESIRFGLPGVDFSGDTITSIVTTITSSLFVEGNNYNVYGFEVQVNGTEGTGGATSSTPEPSTWLLFLSGACLCGVGLRPARLPAKAAIR